MLDSTCTTKKQILIIIKTSMKKTLTYRIMVIIPSDAVEQVCASIKATECLKTDNYADVIWCSSEGVETFTPLEGASPVTGKEGIATEVPSKLIIFSIPRNATNLSSVITAIHESHPWEEPVVCVDETAIITP